MIISCIYFGVIFYRNHSFYQINKHEIHHCEYAKAPQIGLEMFKGIFEIRFCE